MDIEDLKIYRLSMEIGEEIYQIVSQWDFFSKDTVGKQLVRSTDSIAANIAEGYGRFHYGDSKRFNYIARGSLYETKTWVTKAYKRNLIKPEVKDRLLKDLNQLAKMLNAYIKKIGHQLNEPIENYNSTIVPDSITND